MARTALKQHIHPEPLLIRIILILLLIIAAYFVLRGRLKRLSVTPVKAARTAGLSILVLVLIYLAATGRLNWLFALISVALAFLLRLIPAVLHYAPQLHRLWMEFTASRQGATSGQQHNAAAKGQMSIEEAYEVLGLKPGASRQEIIAAHRKLMQKNHPDRGGSDYLAAKINLAKKLLLKK